MDSIPFYDQWIAKTPEDYSAEPDPDWGECARCHRTGHLYSISPVGYGELCNACLTDALRVQK